MFLKDNLEGLMEDFEIQPIEVPAKKPFTLGHFADWIATHDPDHAYDWECVDGSCLVGAYAHEQGVHGRITKNHNWSEAKAAFEKKNGHHPTNGIRALGASYALVVAMTEPWTFGAAHERCLAMMKKYNVE
jgi:hypothetical protein